MKKRYEFVVIGGGISGLVAAISASKLGVKTCLIQDRPVLGGNASSEIRMHICGANRHGFIENARETGVIEDLLLTNRYFNEQQSFSVQDTIFLNMAKEANVDVYLNTRVIDVKCNGLKILSIKAIQTTTEKEFEFSGKMFMDATGDGFVGYKAGALYTYGREAKETYNEPHALDVADNKTMGNSIMFTTKNVGHPIAFKKPSWAYSYSEEDLKDRDHAHIDSGYWWLEVSGNYNTIDDSEEIRDELLKVLYGVWDHIKNGGNHHADNYALDWIGSIPGKRESRRFYGDYVLNENDLFNGVSFYDRVAYGGWKMDVHNVDGIYSTSQTPNIYVEAKPFYSIPYRSLYSKNISNLFLGGRLVSASHLAFSSTRVMGTCASMAEAAGTAAYIVKKYSLDENREVLKYIEELQQLLIKNDAYIPEIVNKDKYDLAKIARVSATSYKEGFLPENVLNGTSRTTENNINKYMSNGISSDGESLIFEFDNSIAASEALITFDSNLSDELTITISEEVRVRQKVFPTNLVKDYSLTLLANNKVVKTIEVNDNILRHNVINFEKTNFNKMVLNCKSTHGAPDISIYEVRLYNK